MNNVGPLRVMRLASFNGLRLGSNGYRRKRKLRTVKARTTIKIPIIISASGYIDHK
jgi:hypothetical protein